MLSKKRLYNFTLREFSNAVAGFRKQKDNESKERWLICRKIMYSAIAPHAKASLKETEILALPWEEKTLKKLSEEEIENLENDVKKSAEFWEKIDAKKMAKC